MHFALTVTNATDISTGIAARGAAASRARAHGLPATSSSPFPTLNIRGILHVYLLHWHRDHYYCSKEPT